MADKKYQPTYSSSDDEHVQPTWNLRRRGRSSLSPPETPSPFVQQFRRRNSLSPLDSPSDFYHTTPRVNTPLGGPLGELSPTLTQSIESIPIPTTKTHKTPKVAYFSSSKRKPTGFQMSKGKKTFEPSAARSSTYSPIPCNMPLIQSSAAKKLTFTPEITLKTTPKPTLPVDSTQKEMSSNIILNIKVLQTILVDVTVCSQCYRGKIIIAESSYKAGCATLLELKCNYCSNSRNYWSVGGKFKGKIPVGNRAVTKRNELLYSSILAGRLIGIGFEKMELYHSALSIPLPCAQQTFSEAQRDIIIAAHFTAEMSMHNAVRELRLLQRLRNNEEYLKTIVSYDGAYQQRSGKSGGGFSRYCFAAAISVHTGKVISYGIACNSCSQCSEYSNMSRAQKISMENYEEWKLQHQPVCPAKYSQFASVQLESALAPTVVRSALNIGVVFSGIVTDGDNKTHESLRKEKVYEHLGIHEIERMECLAHVAKRMKINLCNAQEKLLKSKRTEKEFQKRMLTTAKKSKEEIAKQLNPIFRGKLRQDSRRRGQWAYGPSKAIQTISEATAAQIASYFKLAVKKNAGDIRGIIRAINAIPMHLSASNDNAREKHDLCPKDPDTWCRYQFAKIHNLPTPHHPNYLSEDAVRVIQNVFKDFGYNSPEFVAKVQEGRTSNHNEALHKVLWSMVHKSEFAGNEMMELGSALAVIRYNEGFSGIEKVFNALGIVISNETKKHFVHLDNARIIDSRRIPFKQIQRFSKKQQRRRKTTRQIEKFGLGYSSGRFTAAQTPAEDSTSDEEVPFRSATPLTPEPARPESSGESDVACPICGGTEENGIVGIGVGMNMQSQEISWVQCDICELWHHTDCVGLDKDEIAEDVEWLCENCSML